MDKEKEERLKLQNHFKDLKSYVDKDTADLIAEVRNSCLLPLTSLFTSFNFLLITPAWSGGCRQTAWYASHHYYSDISKYP